MYYILYYICYVYLYIRSLSLSLYIYIIYIYGHIYIYIIDVSKFQLLGGFIWFLVAPPGLDARYTQDAAALGGRAASKLASEQSLDRVQVLGVISTGETPMQIRE